MFASQSSSVITPFWPFCPQANFVELRKAEVQVEKHGLPSPAQRTTDRRTNYLPTDGRKRPVAGIFTAPTSLSAHPAVLHVHLPSVGLALLATQPTRFGASPKSGPDHRRLRLRLPGDDPPCRGAHVR